MKFSTSAFVLAGWFTFISPPSGATGPSGQQKHTVATDSVVKIINNEPFLKVRSRMIKQGWGPVRMHANDGYSYDGAEKRLVEQKIFEVDSCSIDAGANCIFYYRMRQQCLRIDTVGEQVRDLKVTRWTTECPLDKKGQ
jgi:F420-dependent methylenetetrahydromethanopterin dehydrogenase